MASDGSSAAFDVGPSADDDLEELALYIMPRRSVLDQGGNGSSGSTPSLIARRRHWTLTPFATSVAPCPSRYVTHHARKLNLLRMAYSGTAGSLP